MNDIVVYTLLYVLFALCVVFPPTEFVSAGLTLEKLAAPLLGDELTDFFHFHLRRTTFTLFAHSCLPLVYVAYLHMVLPDLETNIGWWSYVYTVLASLSAVLPTVVGVLCFYRYEYDWRNHPAVRALSCYDPIWRPLAEVINTEYRRFDKFAVQLGGANRVIVTDSWVVRIGAYRIDLSHQSDVTLTVVATEEHPLSHHSDSQAVQFVRIRVDNHLKPTIPSFTLRMNSDVYGDLRLKLQAPIRTARDVIIRQSISERFVAAFCDQARSNPSAPELTEPELQRLELCMGCSVTIANVKLEKSCVDLPADQQQPHPPEDGIPEQNCRQCFCRPMWCLACMGRWFASRQQQQTPERWLAGKSPCPTCRATFCVLDVAIVDTSSVQQPDGH